jgi:hypothetical protein
VAENVDVKSNPEEFLRGALEKIVYYKCRISQLNAELSAERATVIREKEAAAVARARELEQEMLLIRTRSELATLKSRSIDLEERVRLLEAERESILSGFVERAQVSGAPGDNDTDDTSYDQAVLAGFIAELRSNIEDLKQWKAAAQKTGITIEEKSGTKLSAQISPISALATQFEKVGRLDVAEYETDRIKEKFSTRAERSLYETSMEDLVTADPERRKRAAECLRALGSPASAPLIATALGRENDPTIKVALLSALTAIGEPSTATLVLREVSDADPEVRAAALDAAATLLKEQAEPTLSEALGDASAPVRRRATLLLGFMVTSSAVNAVITMLSDRDPGVARTAALALSGKPDMPAQSALTKALNHPEPAVRRCAADAVAQWSGKKIDPALPQSELRRAARRLSDKLAKMGQRALRQAMITTPASPAAIERKEDKSIVTEHPVEQQSPSKKTETMTNKDVTAIRTDIAVEDVSLNKASQLETTIISEIRTSLRGRTADELSQFTNTELAAVTACLNGLVGRGTLSQRGSRFFIA